MSKCIFYLDYDGVLHPEPVYRHPKGGMYFSSEHDGHTLFENTGLLINALVRYPNVSIVLSTNWVRVLGYSQAKAYLPRTLQQRVIGATFHSKMDKQEFDAMTRGAQVLADATRRCAKKWIAVDDDDEGWPEASFPHLVLTNGKTGLSTSSAMGTLVCKMEAQLEQ